MSRIEPRRFLDPDLPRDRLRRFVEAIDGPLRFENVEHQEAVLCLRSGMNNNPFKRKI
jgi:hypothetical protein